MAEDQYKDMCAALESHKAHKEGGQEKIIRLDQRLYSLANSTNFSLSIKAYWESKDGFSKRLFESAAANDKAMFHCKGPLGKSLGVKRSGQHLAFAAGTGAITFMDLSAYVARFVMGEMDDKEAEQIGDDFKFTYYVTYFNRKQSCGLRLLELLQSLNSKHFELKLRLSDQKSRRWDQGFLAEHLPDTCEKLWICGTPQMNEVFEKAFFRLAPKFPYLHDLEVVQVL